MEFKRKGTQADKKKANIPVNKETYTIIVDIASREGCTFKEAAEQLLQAGLQVYEQERMETTHA